MTLNFQGLSHLMEVAQHFSSGPNVQTPSNTVHSKKCLFLFTASKNNSMKLSHSKYKIVISETDTAAGATARCQQELGPRASLVRITYEEELLLITPALTSLEMDYDQAFWIGGSPRDAELVLKWAECEPGMLNHLSSFSLSLVHVSYG